MQIKKNLLFNTDGTQVNFKATPNKGGIYLLKTEGTWSLVEVLDTVHGIMNLEGWVSSKFLIK